METIKYKTNAGISQGVREGDFVKYLGNYYSYMAIIIKKRGKPGYYFDILMLKSSVKHENGKMFITELPNNPDHYIFYRP